MTRLLDYLRHIAEAIERIHQYTAGMDQAGFVASKITQDAVIRNIEIIGEAGRNITKTDPAFAAANPHLRLEAAYKMRNAVSHGYFAVDLGIVWATISIDLPKLLSDVKILIESESNN
jgi:uncharacterized protein with HEPN domain